MKWTVSGGGCVNLGIDGLARARTLQPGRKGVTLTVGDTMIGLSDRFAGLESESRHCPLCNGALKRIPRRFIDRLLNMFSPVHRYRCRSMRCGWEGNLPEK